MQHKYLYQSLKEHATKIGVLALIGLLMLVLFLLDSDDAVHAPRSAHPPLLWGYDPPLYEDNCGDGIDNDQDGLNDCEDVDDCSYAAECAEICDNALDDDGDFAVDCDDLICETDPACTDPGQP